MLCTSSGFKDAMRLFPAGVAVIATGGAPDRTGMTVTAFCSLSAEPPQVLVCLNSRTGTSRAVGRNGVFSVNILADAQSGIARRFAGMDGVSGDERFHSGSWTVGMSGVPVLASAVQSMECSLVRIYEAATHLIVIGRVEGLSATSRGQALIYRDGAFGAFLPAEALATAGEEAAGSRRELT